MFVIKFKKLCVRKRHMKTDDVCSKKKCKQRISRATKKKMKKAESQNRHTKKRFSSRYNIEYSQALRKTLIDKIQNNQGILIESQTSNKKVWRVEYGDKYFELVYDKKRQNIATVLPKDYAREMHLDYTPEESKNFLRQIMAGQGDCIEIKNNAQTWILESKGKFFKVEFIKDRNQIGQVMPLCFYSQKNITDLLGERTLGAIKNKIIAGKALHISPKPELMIWLVTIGEIIYCVATNAQQRHLSQISIFKKNIFFKMLPNAYEAKNFCEKNFSFNREDQIFFDQKKKEAHFNLYYRSILYKVIYSWKKRMVTALMPVSELNQDFWKKYLEMTENFYRQMYTDSKTFARKINKELSLWNFVYDGRQYQVAYNSVNKQFTAIIPEIQIA